MVVVVKAGSGYEGGFMDDVIGNLISLQADAICEFGSRPRG